jgi:tetratricopeptide (TPR) repeat protein
MAIWEVMNQSSLEKMVRELSTIIANSNSPDEQASLKALAFRACIYREQGCYVTAIADFTELIRRLPCNVDLYKERALLYVEEKRNGDAIEDFNRIIEIAPDGWTYANRGALFVRLRRLDDAIDDLKQALQFGNITTEVCFNWGLAHHHKKDYREAILGFNDAISLDPTYIKAIMHRGMAHSRLGEYLLAVKNYEGALEIDPDYTNGTNNLAWLLATCPNPSFRDGERALKLAQTA